MDYLSLCLICKDENDYLSEWLDYHILMGVDRFYIYDNESRVSLRESLEKYVDLGWVVVVDISGKAMQLHAYDHCLHTFGPQTFWMGFIDTDEFLVLKTTLGLKEFLKGYESYAGLAVSSLFFGSSGHKKRPADGQIAAYTSRTRATFKENELVKSIVQPGLALMPNSPHDFSFKENAWCVNEAYLRVDFQRFPNSTEKIQLNHYYCRSENEIDQKLRRGNSGDIAWPRRLFEAVNLQASTQDTCILQNLETLFQQAGREIQITPKVSLLEKMSMLAQVRHPMPLEIIPPQAVHRYRVELSGMEELKAKTQAAISRKEFEDAKRLMLSMIQKLPQNIILYDVLAGIYLDLGDRDSAWQALSQAWQRAPNNDYVVLRAMAFYFLRIENFSMAENSCRLMLELTPHDLIALGLLTASLMGQGQKEEALKIGIPLVEHSAELGELPERMGVILVKNMADYLLEKKDYAGAARLWESGVKCQPGDVNLLLELIKVLLLAGDKTNARKRLAQAQAIAPQNEAVLAMFKEGSISLPTPSLNKKKRQH